MSVLYALSTCVYVSTDENKEAEEGKKARYPDDLRYAKSYPQTRCNTTNIRLLGDDFAAMKALDTLDNPHDHEGYNPLENFDGKPHEFKSAWDTLAALDAEVSIHAAAKHIMCARDPTEHTRRAVFVCHTTDVPPQQERYDPYVDVEEFHIGILQLTIEAAGDTGWAVAKFTSRRREEKYGDESAWVVDVVYMQPARLSGTVWPENWVTRALVPIKGKKRGSEWDQKSFPLDNVVWSTEPKSDSQGNVTWKIPSAVQKTALKAVERIKAWHADHPDREEAKKLLNAPGQRVRMS